MFNVSTFFFSQIIGSKVLSPDGKTIGRLKDLTADSESLRPKIVAATVLCGNEPRTVDFSYFQISNIKGKCSLICEQLMPVSLEGTETIQLVRQLLDNQVVDMNKKKLVRVNDLKIAVLNSGAYVAAVDAGLKGRLRRLGIAELVQRMLKLFDVSIPNRLILWDDIEAIDFSRAGAELSNSISGLHRLHPSDMADIIEDMDRNTQVEVFSALDMKRAADVLEELESDTREGLLESLPTNKIADVLENMPADEVADILEEMDEDKAEELLKEMESGASDEVRELMEYEDSEVGSLMTTDYISFRNNETVGNTLETLRREKPEPEMIYYLYIVSDKGELKAMVSLRDVVVSDPDVRLDDIMDKDVIYVFDTDKIESLIDIIDKYSLLAVPVVDAAKVLLGIVIINDVVYDLLRTKRKRVTG